MGVTVGGCNGKTQIIGRPQMSTLILTKIEDNLMERVWLEQNLITYTKTRAVNTGPNRGPVAV